METIKQVKLYADAKEEIYNGLNIIANAVKSTMGPGGNTVILDRGEYSEPVLTKDGVSVASSIRLENKYQDLVCRIVMQAAQQTAMLAGDGTTTSIVLVQSIMNEAKKYIESGYNVNSIKRGLDKLSKFTIEKLKKLTKEISSAEEIYQVAKISANGDDEIAKLVVDAIEGVSVDGLIMVQEGYSPLSNVSFIDGFELQSGYLGDVFINDSETNTVILSNPHILLSDDKITTISQLHQPISYALNNKKPILIIAQDFSSEFITEVIQTNVKCNKLIHLIKSSAFGEERKKQLKDLSILTGGNILSTEAGISFSDYKVSYLGSAEKIQIFKERTLITNPKGNQDEISSHIKKLQEYTQSKDIDLYVRHLAIKRLALLRGKAAVITVGGSSAVEIKEKKDRIEDAVFATKAASIEGVVPGGGVALVKLINYLDDKSVNLEEDEKVSLKIFKEVLKSPITTISNNAGFNASEVEILVRTNEDFNFGFDARSGSYCNLINAGILDPVKVTRLALEHAISVASSLLTTSVIVSELKK